MDKIVGVHEHILFNEELDHYSGMVRTLIRLEETDFLDRVVIMLNMST